MKTWDPKTAARKPCRGGAPVGYLEEFGGLEASAILYMRQWCAGGSSLERVREDFIALLGPKRGEAALLQLGSLIGNIYEHGRRPMMRHQETCRCVGGDEAAFANMIASAVEQDREDAMLLATLFMRADMAMLTVALAQEFGLSLKLLVNALSDVQAKSHPAKTADARTIH